VANPPHNSTLPLTSHPWPPHLSPINSRFAGPCPSNVSRRAEDDHVGLSCRLLHVIPIPHPLLVFLAPQRVRLTGNGRAQGLTRVTYRPLPAPWVA
jgi:hypothetical protein